MADGLYHFRAHMAEVARQVRSAPAPPKVQRYVRMFEASLPLDITVRWYPAGAVNDMEARVEELTGQGREVWISQGLARDPAMGEVLASVEKRTVLLKNLNSVNDFRSKGVPRLQEWAEGSWAKMYYDTPGRSLTGGTIGFDTSRSNAMMLKDGRAVRFEAATGISDVRDLQRQMSARQVVVASANAAVFSELEQALEPMECTVLWVADLSDAVNRVRDMGPAEPRAVMIDGTGLRSEALRLLDDLKASGDTACIPVILIAGAPGEYPAELRARVASVLSYPASAEEVRNSVSRTGFRLLGDASGFQFDLEDSATRREVDRLLTTVMGAGGKYRRMMAQIANLEARPTIAFEFKLVPLAPYEFFFIDYEWSGEKHPLHRFDWVYSLASH